MLILLTIVVFINVLFAMAQLVQLSSINQHIMASFNIEYKEEVEAARTVLEMLKNTQPEVVSEE